MTQSVETPYSISTGTGSTTAYPFTFSVESSAEIEVRLITIATGAIGSPLTLNTHYTVALTAIPSGGLVYPGGTVTMVTAPTTLQKLWIRRVTELDQEVDIQQGGNLNTAGVEGGMDKLVRILAEHDARLDVLPTIEPSGGTFTIPTPSSTYNDYTLGVAGGVYAFVQLATGTFSLSGNTANNIVYFGGATTLSGEAAFTYNPSTNTMAVDNVAAATKISAGTDDVMTVAGSVVTSHVAANSDTLAVIESHTHSATAGSGAVFYHARSRGTTASPAVVQNGDTIGTFAAVGFDGTDYAVGGYIVWAVSGTPGSNDMPTEFSVWTTPDGSQTPVKNLAIGPTGAATFTADVSVPDEAYGSAWNGSLEVPTKNAIFDAFPAALARSNGLITVGNTDVETALLSFTLAGGALATNRAVRIRLYGHWSHDGTNQLDVKLKYGGTTLATSTVVTTTGATTLPIDFDCVLRANNSASAQVGIVETEWRDDSSAYSFIRQAYGTATEASAGDLTLQVTVQWTTADASDTLSMASEATLI